MNSKFDGWPNVVESQQFAAAWLDQEFFPLASEMVDVYKSGGNDLLRGMRMVSLFFEPSTRTRMSFETAMHMLGGRVVFATENASQFSSAVKGETLTDTIEVANEYYPHVIVLRHHDDDSAEQAVKASVRASVINAGSGRKQHPTQALLDLFTIRQKFPEIKGIKVAICGDLANGRTVRSLSYLLGKYEGVRIYFVAPTRLAIKQDIKDYLVRHNVCFEEVDDIHAVAEKVNVIYQTRTQKERGGSMEFGVNGHFRIDQSVLDLMRQDAIIMHPMPIDRHNLATTEIDPIVDNDPRAVYKRLQIGAGLATRMAILKMILAPEA